MKQVVAIAVMDGDKMLMGRRRDSGKWTNPGGHMEPGEDHKEAAHRELREEAGIDVADMTYLGSRVTKTDDGERLLIHCYYCHIPTGCPTTMKEDPDEEVHRWHWINIAGGVPLHVHDDLHVPMDRNILMQLLECTDVKKSDLEKGARGDWKNEGYTIHPFTEHSKGRAFVASHESDLGDVFPENVAGNHSVYAKKDGKIIGHAQFSDTDQGLVPTQIRVLPEHQRKGIARALVSGIEEASGKKVSRSDNETNEGKAFFVHYTKKPIAIHETSRSIKKSLSEIYDLIKNKKEMIQMYPEEKRQEAAPFVKWAHQTLPNMNWKTWAVRNHKEKPQDFTPEVKQKLQHFAGSQHVPNIANIRFEKRHDLDTGLKMLQDAENAHHKELKNKLNLVPAEGEVITKTPSGKIWVNLHRPSCEDEGSSMGHCGNVPTEKVDDEVLSLRTVHKIGDREYHQPHLTFINNVGPKETEKGLLGEMKGHGNLKPAKHYHDDIMKLLEKGYVPIGGGYKPENNFHIDDLSNEQKDHLMQINPDALVGSKTHAAPAESLNKVIKAMKWGAYTPDKTEDDGSDYVEAGQYIPSLNVADAIALNPGLNKNHIKEIQEYLKENDSDNVPYPYDYENSLMFHHQNAKNKLLRNKNFSFDKLKELLNAETSDYEHNDWEDGSPIDNAGHNPNLTPEQFAELAVLHGNYPQTDHPKINKDYVNKIADILFRKEGDPVSRTSTGFSDGDIKDHLGDLIRQDDSFVDKRLLDKITGALRPEDSKGLKHFFGMIGNHPELNKDHFKKMLSADMWGTLDATGHRDDLISSEFIDSLLDIHRPENITEAEWKQLRKSWALAQGLLPLNKNWNRKHTLKALDVLKSNLGQKELYRDVAQKILSSAVEPAVTHHPLDNEILDKIEELPKKEQEHFYTLIPFANRHLTLPIIERMMPKTKKEQRSFLAELNSNTRIPYETKKAVFSGKAFDLHLSPFKTIHPIPEKEFHDAWNKIKQALSGSEGPTRDQLNDLYKMTDHQNIPISVLEEIEEASKGPEMSDWFRDVLADAIRRKKEKLKKTAMVGHGVLGAPTSLVGGATGAYGLKPPAMNPDIQGEGGMDRARTAIGKLFGKKDTEEMLAALNKNENGENPEEAVNFSDKEISFPHNKKQHTLGYKDSEHPRTAEELYDKHWHQERANHDMADWFKRHATKEDLMKVLNHFHHDLPFVRDHDLRGKDPDGIVKNKEINFLLHGIAHRHPAYEDVLADARHYLPGHLHQYEDDEHYDDLHDRFLDFAHEQAHIKAQEEAKNEQEKLKKGDLRHRRRFQLKPTKEQAEKIEKAGLGAYFNNYPSLGHVDYDLPENGDLHIEDIQTSFDKSPLAVAKEKLNDLYQNKKISFPQKEALHKESRSVHPYEHHKFLTDVLFQGHDPKEVLKKAFDTHMKNYGAIPTEGLFENALDSEFYRDDALRKDDEGGTDEMTAEKAAEVFKEINASHEARGMAGNQFIDKYRIHPKAPEIEAASLEALESNDPEKFTPWAKAYFQHTPPDIAEHLMRVVTQRSNLLNNPLFQNALAKEVPHFKEGAIHPFMKNIETKNLTEESLNHILPSIMNMEDHESKGQYLRNLLKNQNINEDHVKKILEAGHEIALSHPKAPADAKKKFLENASPEQLWRFYEKSYENMNDDDLDDILNHPKLNLLSNTDAGDGPKWKNKIIEHALTHHPLASFDKYYPMIKDEETQTRVLGAINNISSVRDKFHKEAAENPNIMKNLIIGTGRKRGFLAGHTGRILQAYLDKAKEEKRTLSPDFINEAVKFVSGHDDYNELIPSLLNHHENITDDHLNELASTNLTGAFPRNIGVIARHPSPAGEKIRQKIIENPMEYETLGNSPIENSFAYAGKEQAEKYLKDFEPAAKKSEGLDQFFSKHIPNAIGPQVPPNVHLGVSTDFSRENEKGAPGKTVYTWMLNGAPVDFHQPPGEEPPQVRRPASPEENKLFDTKEEAREYAKGFYGEGLDRGVKHQVVHGLLRNPHVRKQLDLPEIIEGLYDQGINFNNATVDRMLRNADEDELEKYLNHEKLHREYLKDKSYGHPLHDFKNELMRKLEDGGFVVNHDSVTMSHDTAKLREIRDKIDETGGEVHKRDIEKLGYNLASLGLNDKISPQGKLSAESVQKAIEEKPKHTFGVGHTGFGTTGSGQEDYYFADQADGDGSEPTDDDWDQARDDAEDNYPIYRFFNEHKQYRDLDPDDELWQKHLSDDHDDWVIENPHHDPDYYHWAKQIAERKDPHKEGIYKVHREGDWLDQLVKYDNLKSLPTDDEEAQKKKFEQFKEEIKKDAVDNPRVGYNPMTFHDLARAYSPNISVHHESPAAAYHQNAGRGKGLSMEDHPEYEDRREEARDKVIDEEDLYNHEDIVEDYREYLRDEVADRAYDLAREHGGGANEESLARQEQRHSTEPSKVFQLNWTNDHVKQMKDAGVFDKFQKHAARWKTNDRIHPEGPNTIGWVRYTKGDDGVHIDEIQSPLGQSFNEHTKKLKQQIENGTLPPHQAEEAKKDAADLDKIHGILFGNTKNHPNNIIHDAFLQHLRDRGYAGQKVHLFQLPAAQEKGGHSTRRDPSVHMKETYDKWPKKQGGYKPAKYGELKTQTGADWHEKNTWGQVLKKMQELKDKINAHNT